MFMRVFLDDVRPAPEGWVLVKSAPEAIDLILNNWNKVEIVSLDHDLGEGKNVGNGYDVICAIEKFVNETDTDHLPCLRVHSANPVGRSKMLLAISSITNTVLMRQFDCEGY